MALIPANYAALIGLLRLKARIKVRDGGAAQTVTKPLWELFNPPFYLDGGVLSYFTTYIATAFTF